VVRARLHIRMNCPREVIALFELSLGLMIEIPAFRSDYSVKHPTRSKFELGEDTGLNALEVATRHTFAKG